jgi:hypothetical protein
MVNSLAAETEYLRADAWVVQLAAWTDERMAVEKESSMV